ncbi:GroES-like protein [Trametes cingulata]|nr:GroES-like protein [Trametes cingulata]
MPSLTSQKALILPAKQGQFQVGETIVPKPGPKDVLVKLLSAALNPLDWKIQAFGIYVEDFPWIAGSDGAGTVEEVGTEVTNRRVGDQVFFQGTLLDPRGATFQQYCIVPAELTGRIPTNISFDQAATLASGVSTIMRGVYNHHPQARSLNYTAPWEEGGKTKYAGKPALILGGSSSVGQYAIQLAKLSGFSPIVTMASPSNEQLLLSLGATHVVDRSLPAEAIQRDLIKLVGGKPIDFILDAISVEETQVLAYDVLAPGGDLLLTLPDLIPAEKKAGHEKHIVFTYGTVHDPENREVSIIMYNVLSEWLENGWVVPNNVEVLPNGLAGIPDGLERLKNNKVSAMKLVARPQETP